MNIEPVVRWFARLLRACLRFATVVVLLLFRVAHGSDAATERLGQEIQALLAEKGLRTPAQQKMDSQLLQAVRESRGQPMAAGVNLEPARVGADENGRLVVDINARSAATLDALTVQIEALGGEILTPSWQFRSIRARIDLAQAEAVASLADVTFIQPAVRSVHAQSARSDVAAPPAAPVAPGSFGDRAARVRAQLGEALRRSLTGTINSQGDRAHRADDARNTYGYSGAGIRIGVLSDSYNALGGAAADVANGNLPGPGNPLGHLTPVTVIQDFPSGTDEGRAMMQIVHDLAPEAQLFFATADTGEAGFAANIQALRNPPYNCDVIIDDVFYFDEPVFQDGIVAQAVNAVTSAGALYFSSAGNEGSFAKGTAGVFEGDFNDAGSPVFAFPGGAKSGTIHNFGTPGSPINGDIVTAAGIAYNLNWADPAGASGNDYDLFLVSSTGTVKGSSTNLQNGTQLAYEQITPPALVAGDRLVVFKTAAAQVRAISINTIRGRLTLATTGQTHGHSSALNAFSVAAAPAAGAFNASSPVGPFPGAYGGSNQVELFTSDGPRRIFFDATGTPITPGNFLFGTNGGTVRNKPDITAADGVSTTLSPSSGLNPFFGTSAAAPHAGAIAGLLKSANPALTPAQIRTILTTTAVDVESAGYDNISGFGVVQAFQAMQAVAPTPQAAVTLGTVAATEGAFSNSNGFIDPGELASIVVQLTNPSLVSASGVQATLTTSTAGVTVTQGSASYGTIGAASSATNGATPFVAGVSSSVPCGTVVSFFLTVSFGGGSSPQVFPFSVPTGRIPGASISGTLGSAPPTGTGFTSTNGQQTGRISRSGVSSSCAAPKANPGLTTVVGSRQFDAYTFTNTNASAQCVTVTLTSPNGSSIYTATYTSAGFVPSDPSTNYLADPGSSGATQTYSFTAPAGQAFTTVVHDVNVTPASGITYTLSVSLAACAGGPACTPVSITNASIASGATGAVYAQSFAATGGSGVHTFSVSGGLPAGLSFSGNTLSGTPTQAGSFPISVTATDVAGCPPDTKPFTLVIAGNAPASVVATAGSGQTTLPATTFPTALQATVRDGASAPLAGVNVTFTAPGSGASGTFPGGVTSATVVSGAGGLATAPAFTANTTTGGYAVTANVNGVAPASFTLNNSCPASFVVTSGADSGAGTLRDFVNNACVGITVTFDPGVSLVTLTSGDLAITKAITINGPGANLLAVSGNNLSRVFNIAAGAAAVSISGMTIRDGKPSGGTTGGGGILINNGASVGAVTLSNCVISGNDASLAGNPLGGGIDNEGGTVTIDRCSIVNNVATFRGGGLQNQGFGSMAITNSTIAGNTAGTTGIGGGIRSLLPLTLTSCTIFGNSAQTAGNVSRSGGTITFGNTIIAGGLLIGSGGSAPDLSGAAGLASANYNLIQDTTGATISGTTTNNITGVSPNLLPLANRGGPSPTLLPQPGSPVLNAGDPATAAPTDQRGFPRVVGSQADIGAVEASYALAATGGTPQTTLANTPFPVPLQATLTESGGSVDGISVTFTAPTTGASGLFGATNVATVATVAGGVAVAPTFTANGTGGSYAVSASTAGPVAPATFNLTNTLCPPPPPLVVDAPSVVGAGSPNRVATVAPIGGAAYAWTITNGTITSGQNTNQITFTAGTAGTPLTLSVSATAAGCPAGSGGATVTVAPAGSATQFYVVTPCRLVDTRNAGGPFGGPALGAAGAPDRSFVLAGTCGIPAGATVVSANVTVVGASALGHLSIYPGDGSPTGTSVINFNPANARASNALLRLALDGSGSVKVTNGASGAVHLVLDVNGYFQ